MNNTTNQTLDGPALTFTGVRLTGLTVKSLFLRTLDLGMGTFADSRRRGCDDDADATERVPQHAVPQRKPKATEEERWHARRGCQRSASLAGHPGHAGRS